MTRPMVSLIDVSKHQGAIDFNVMRSRGVTGLIIRLGNGKTLDPMAPTYIRNAKTAGFPIGAYWFCNPKADPRGDTQMARFAAECERLGALDIPPMMDIENYLGEAGSYPVLSGSQLSEWIDQGVDQLDVEFGAYPLIYSNAAYYSSQHMTASSLQSRCPLICARYPFYYEGCPAPPPSANLWEAWLYGSTTKRPIVPIGFDGWQGWQFSAGYNRQGPVYGASSSDLDLNLIQADAWDHWTSWQGQAVPDVPEVPDLPPPPPINTLIGDDMNFYLANVTDGPAAGLGLVVQLVIGDDHAPHHRTFGFLDEGEMNRWKASGCPVWPMSGADFDDLQNTKVD